jgi:peroxiredoxin Q/BCP
MTDAAATVRLEPGDAAPPLGLTDDHGTVHTWKDHAGERVVLYVYPAAMTPGCTTQACDFRDSLDSLAAAGITVLGLSPDKPEKLVAFRERDGLTFPLLSDPDRTVLAAYGAYGEKKRYGKTVVGVIRSTFVVDVDAAGKARIERAMYAVKATGHVAKLRKELGV